MHKKIVTIIVLCTVTLLLASLAYCQKIEPLSLGRYKEVVSRSGGFAEGGVVFDIMFPKLVPLEFLQFLATKPDTFVLITMSPARKWVKKEDVAELIKYVKSKQPCSVVISNSAEFIPTKSQSTIGFEAMCIISFYRGESYPGDCNSLYYNGPKKQDGMAKEYLKWWEKIKNK